MLEYFVPFIMAGSHSLKFAYYEKQNLATIPYSTHSLDNDQTQQYFASSCLARAVIYKVRKCVSENKFQQWSHNDKEVGIIFDSPDLKHWHQMQIWKIVVGALYGYFEII